jgi:3-dehydroquinate synthase
MDRPDAADTFKTVEVDLAERSYPILIGTGLVETLDRHVSAVLPKSRVAIVADEAVAAIAEQASKALSGSGRVAGPAILVPSGEGSKSFAQLETVSRALLDRGLDRKDAVIAIGGGVIGDLAGFAAAIYKRGIPLVQVPTTLLAQVDSSVGGKTGINTSHGKNLIGAFHQPSLVVIDLATLATLPPREFRAGYAEVVKYGALGDAAFFAWLEANRAKVFAKDTDALSTAIATSCEMKGGIVSRDERETGERALLNLGHTFGHAVEAWAGYSGMVLHGEAVALGMALAARFSVGIGVCAEASAKRLAAHLADAGFSTTFGELKAKNGLAGLPDAETLLHYMAQDKKAEGGQLNLILLEDIGHAFVAKGIARDAVRAFLTTELAE